VHKTHVAGAAMIVLGLLILVFLASFVVSVILVILQLLAVVVGILLVAGGVALLVFGRWLRGDGPRRRAPSALA
jgi:membrane-bound ClpP family serine protease